MAGVAGGSELFGAVVAEHLVAVVEPGFYILMLYKRSLLLADKWNALVDFSKAFSNVCLSSLTIFCSVAIPVCTATMGCKEPAAHEFVFATVGAV